MHCIANHCTRTVHNHRQQNERQEPPLRSRVTLRQTPPCRVSQSFPDAQTPMRPSEAAIVKSRPPASDRESGPSQLLEGCTSAESAPGLTRPSPLSSPPRHHDHLHPDTDSSPSSALGLNKKKKRKGKKKKSRAGRRRISFRPLPNFNLILPSRLGRPARPPVHLGQETTGSSPPPCRVPCTPETRKPRPILVAP
jgi:hypothetical protein